MRKQRTTLPLARLQLNEGQLDWLPRNPRQWTQTDIDNTKDSLTEDPDFLEDRPVLVLPLEGSDDFVVFAHNLCTHSARKLRWKEVPCVVYYPEDADDRLAVIRRAIKDNGSYGEWDPDILANEWDDMPLADWGMPSWVTGEGKGGSDLGLSTKGREGEDENYDAFVHKFKQKLTTDDCYTPPAVFDAVRDFVDQHITPLKGKTVVRPFVPGGDYEHFAYRPNSIVVDNPPFSLLAQICRFYSQKGIPFFIFAPQLTLFTATDCDLTYIISDTDIEYENGARVRTGFITNLVPDLRIWCCPDLRDRIIKAQPGEDKTKRGFVYPDNIVTSAILSKIVKRSIELKIRKESCEAIKQSDSAEEQGRALYGRGYIMSDYRESSSRESSSRESSSHPPKSIR